MTRKPDARSAEAQAYRPWYSTARWQKLRAMRLAQEPLCRMCALQDRVTAANVVDHIKAHKGDPELFWSFENTQSLCQPHHDGAKQAEERRGYSLEVGTDGWPIDDRHPVNATR